ncbi:MAG: hypothetical protein DRJ61_09515, partial [Acidobacteria bacterium]
SSQLSALSSQLSARAATKRHEEVQREKANDVQVRGAPAPHNVACLLQVAKLSVSYGRLGVEGFSDLLRLVTRRKIR